MTGRAPLAGLVALLAACATARPPPPAGAAPAGAASPAAPGAGAAALAFPPESIEVSRLDLELAGRNDEELFAIGQAAFAAGDLARAATAFGRLADLFPRSRHLAAALFDAGLAEERRGAPAAALARYEALAAGWEGPDAIEAAFRAAGCLARLGSLDAARAALDRIAARPDLGADGRVRALTERGVIEREGGRTEEAERTLRLALAAWRAAGDVERIDDAYPARAEFTLGEIYRDHFLAVRLDPAASSEEALARALEDKAALLLSAQGHYLRAIRIGNAEWAIAAGARIGGLYDAFHAALVGAPLPPGLDAEAAAAYRGELRRRVRVLVTKAAAVYEQTLAVAGRARLEDDRFVAEARASLDRVRRELEAGPDDAPEAAPPPAAGPPRPAPGAASPPASAAAPAPAATAAPPPAPAPGS